jgi:hypothetical protein
MQTIPITQSDVDSGSIARIIDFISSKWPSGQLTREQSSQVLATTLGYKNIDEALEFKKNIEWNCLTPPTNVALENFLDVYVPAHESKIGREFFQQWPLEELSFLNPENRTPLYVSQSFIDDAKASMKLRWFYGIEIGNSRNWVSIRTLLTNASEFLKQPININKTTISSILKSTPSRTTGYTLWDKEFSEFLPKLAAKVLEISFSPHSYLQSLARIIGETGLSLNQIEKQYKNQFANEITTQLIDYAIGVLSELPISSLYTLNRKENHEFIRFDESNWGIHRYEHASNTEEETKYPYLFSSSSLLENDLLLDDEDNLYEEDYDNDEFDDEQDLKFVLLTEQKGEYTREFICAQQDTEDLNAYQFHNWACTIKDKQGNILSLSCGAIFIPQFLSGLKGSDLVMIADMLSDRDVQQVTQVIALAAQKSNKMEKGITISRLSNFSMDSFNRGGPLCIVQMWDRSFHSSAYKGIGLECLTEAIELLSDVFESRLQVAIDATPSQYLPDAAELPPLIRKKRQEDKMLIQEYAAKGLMGLHQINNLMFIGAEKEADFDDTMRLLGGIIMANGQ